MLIRFVKKDRGMTLVEVLASLVLLSIMIVSFLAIFPTVAKQNKTSEEFMDATYIAQSSMEHIIRIKDQNNSLHEMVNKLTAEETNSQGEKNINYKAVSSTANEIVLERVASMPSYKVTIIFDKLKTYQTSHVRVIVSQIGSKEKPRAQMETILWWGDNQ